MFIIILMPFHAELAISLNIKKLILTIWSPCVVRHFVDILNNI